jgi:uncharacterized protein
MGRTLAAFLLFAALLPAQEKKYEMTTYVLGLLKPGPSWTPQVTEEAKRIQEGHMANIRRMAEAGRLIVAGPTKGDDLRGIFIFKGGSMDEIQAMVNDDPAVKAGRLVVTLYPWYAAKGLRVDDPK